MTIEPETAKGPFKAVQHESGWWVVQDRDGTEIDESGDGGFKQATAEMIADALNTLADQPTLPAAGDEVRQRANVLCDIVLAASMSEERIAKGESLIGWQAGDNGSASAAVAVAKVLKERLACIPSEDDPASRLQPTEADALSVERLGPWLQHHSDCVLRGHWMEAAEKDCDCGLAAALNQPLKKGGE